MNMVVLIGRLTKDPEYTAPKNGGNARTTFTLAVDRRYAAQNGERLADFPNIVCWGNTAEFAAKYLTKGGKYIIAGRLQTRSYDAQDGSKRFVTEVVADNIEFCESRKAQQRDEGVVGYERTEVNGRQVTMAEVAPTDELPF